MYKRREVKLDDGRIVSRQRYHILNNEEAHKKSLEYKKKYNKKYSDSFREKHGMSYYMFNKHKNN